MNTDGMFPDEPDMTDEALEALQQLGTGDMAYTDVLALGYKLLDESPCSSAIIAANLYQYFADDDGIMVEPPPEYARIMELMGRSQQKLEQHQFALDSWHQLCEEFPTHVLYKVLYAQSLMECGEDERAEIEIGEVKDLQLTDNVMLELSLYYEIKMEVLAEDKDIPGAQEAMQKAREYAWLLLSHEDVDPKIKQEATSMLLRLRDDKDGPSNSGEIAFAM